MIYIIWTLLFLLVCTITDLKERMIVTWFCFINSGAALAVNFFLRNQSEMNILFGMIMGAVFYVISACSKEAVGKGDAVVIFTIGSMVGINPGFEIVTWAFMLCALVSAVGMISKKLKLKSRLPFMPFMLMGGIITFIIGGV